MTDLIEREAAVRVCMDYARKYTALANQHEEKGCGMLADECHDLARGAKHCADAIAALPTHHSAEDTGISQQMITDGVRVYQYWVGNPHQEDIVRAVYTAMRRALPLDSIAAGKDAKSVMGTEDTQPAAAGPSPAAPPQGLVHELLWTAEHAPFVTKQAEKVMREAAAALSQREGYVSVNIQPDGGYPGCDACACPKGKCQINAMLAAAPGRGDDDLSD